MLDDIEMLTAGDVKKQDALAKAIMSRISGKKALGDNTDEGWSLIQESLKHFFSSLHEKYKGRFPNNVRAAHQAVCAAISGTVPQKSLLVIAGATGASVDALKRGQQRWIGWIEDRGLLYDLRGKERSDKLPDKYVQLAVSVWEQVTRPSERKKDQLKPPFQKDGPLHAVHWLEMRIAEVHAAILEKGKETFGDEFHFSFCFTFAVKPWFVKKVERDLCLCIYHRF